MATIIEDRPVEREVVQNSDSGGSAALIVLTILIIAIIAAGVFYYATRSGYTIQAPSPTHAVTSTLSNTDANGQTTEKSLTVKGH
jgi:hypothetical protein